VEKGNPSEEDLKLARQGMELARKAVHDQNCDILILDEVNVAADYGLVKVADVLDVVKHRPASMEIIMTGRYAPKEFLEVADLVTEMKEIKHHYANGLEMREGIEY
jgi:cob(I)alamin adenosyltransferase